MKQDLAVIRGWGYVGGLTPDEAGELVRLIPTLSTDTLRWGSAEGREPQTEPDGRVRVAMQYGPVHGAWKSDLKKRLRAAADRVQPDAAVEVVSHERVVLTDLDDVQAEADIAVEQENVLAREAAIDSPPADLAAREAEAEDEIYDVPPNMSTAQLWSYERMGSPEVARFPQPLLVRVGGEVHAIHPDGRVQGPNDGRPR